MLYVVSVEKEIPWYIGEKFHAYFEDTEKLLATVIEVQADGDELDWVKSNITGIPFNKNTVQSWYGDIAKFIANSLPKK